MIGPYQKKLPLDDPSPYRDHVSFRLKSVNAVLSLKKRRICCCRDCGFRFPKT